MLLVLLCQQFPLGSLPFLHDEDDESITPFFGFECPSATNSVCDSFNLPSASPSPMRFGVVSVERLLQSASKGN